MVPVPKIVDPPVAVNKWGVGAAPAAYNDSQIFSSGDHCHVIDTASARPTTSDSYRRALI